MDIKTDPYMIEKKQQLTLEVGCGTTLSDIGCEKSNRPRKYRTKFRPKVKGENVVYVDLTMPSIKTYYFVVADAQLLPFRNKIFKDVYASHLIEHLPKPEKFLREARRVSTGKIHIWCPNIFSWGATKWNDPTHKHIFSYPKLRHLLIKAGYRIIENPDFTPASRIPLTIAKILRFIFLITSNELHVEART
jgi:ubiquinone/menaquinone biosynthesis C-methylase UbiE